VSAALQEIADGLGVRLLTLCGGVAQEWQERELALGPQLLVATPGRLRDLLAQQTLGLGALRMLVLDEADRLLEMGFWPEAWPRACCRIRCVSRPSRSTAW